MTFLKEHFIFFLHIIVNIFIANCNESANETFVTTPLEIDNVCDNSSEICSFTTEGLSSEFTNFSEVSSIDNISNLSATTKLIPKTETTPLPMTTEAVPRKKEKFQPPDHCSCDLTSQKCDINCCCDSDCNESDRNVFSFCNTKSLKKPLQHSGLCFSHQFIYKNNTRYSIVKEEKGLFCISKDNFPDRLHFLNQKVITSLERFNKVWKRNHQFTWTLNTNFGYTEQLPTQFYKYGDLIWKYNNLTSELRPLDFPVPLISNYCSSTRQIKFLKNFYTHCLRKIPKDGKGCETDPHLNPESYCNSFKLIGKPNVFNQSNMEESSGAFVSIRKLMCEHSGICSEIQSFPSPLYNETSNICLNAVKKINFIMYHNGSSGIIEAECIVFVQNVHFNIHSISQAFEVSFEWIKNETNIFYRSGTPGYLEGKPLISGKHVIIKMDKLNKETTIVSKDPEEWIGIPKANFKGDCDGKINLPFGENMQTQCLLELKNVTFKTDLGCSKIFSKIWSILVGDVKLNESDSQQMDLLIASYGDPIPGNKDDWVPVYLENSNSDFNNQKAPCQTILSGIKYRILYSHFGPFSTPQTKIIGVSAKFLTNDITCLGDTCRLKIISAVNYIDVSLNAINKFAKAPVVKIKLPQDFFYPFSSKSPKMKEITVMILSFIFFLAI